MQRCATWSIGCATLASPERSGDRGGVEADDRDGVPPSRRRRLARWAPSARVSLAHTIASGRTGPRRSSRPAASAAAASLRLRASSRSRRQPGVDRATSTQPRRRSVPVLGAVPSCGPPEVGDPAMARAEQVVDGQRRPDGAVDVDPVVRFVLVAPGPAEGAEGQCRSRPSRAGRSSSALVAVSTTASAAPVRSRSSMTATSAVLVGRLGVEQHAQPVVLPSLGEPVVERVEHQPRDAVLLTLGAHGDGVGTAGGQLASRAATGGSRCRGSRSSPGRGSARPTRVGWRSTLETVWRETPARAATESRVAGPELGAVASGRCTSHSSPRIGNRWRVRAESH